MRTWIGAIFKKFYNENDLKNGCPPSTPYSPYLPWPGGSFYGQPKEVSAIT
jgi:hypothetical protein